MPILETYIYTAKTKKLYKFCTMSDQRRRRWADVVQMLYKCFLLAWYTVSIRKNSRIALS